MEWRGREGLSLKVEDGSKIHPLPSLRFAGDPLPLAQMWGFTWTGTLYFLRFWKMPTG